jgi:Ca2+-binding EF-hand superfamily protein
MKLAAGHYPYIDPVTPETPDLARTLKAIVAGGEPDWAAPHWAALSEGARAFVRALLVHDPAGRPSAAAAMALPWLADPARHATERPLHRSVVQRIQRFGQTSLFRRTVLEHVARDLVALHYAPGGAAARNRSLRGGGSARGGTGLRGFLEKSFHGRERGEGSAAEERSVKGFLERSFRGRTLSKGSAAGERSLKGFLERSFRGRTFSDASVRSARSTGSGGDGPIATPYSRRLAVVLDALDADADGNVDRPRLRAALDALGYRLGAREADDLFAIVDVAGAGVVSRAQVAAALVDWRWVADAHRERWVAAARRVFEGLDADGDGALSEAEIAGALGGQLSEWEVGAAVRGALAEAAADDEGAAAGGGAGGAAPTAVDFDAFLRILSAPPELDDLELYDDRLSVHASRRASRDMGPPAGAGGCCSIS